MGYDDTCDHFWPFFWMGRHGPRRPPPPPGFSPPPPPPPPGPPPWVLELMGIRPRRAERGDVRYLILDAIEAQPRHGYEIIQAIEQRTGGRYKPSPGTVYPTLQMLEEMGHATSREESGRKVFAITDEGRKDLEAHRDEVEDAYDRLGDTMDWVDPAEFHELVRRIRRLMHSVGRALHRGRLGPEQLGAIRSAIEDAAAKIEATLEEARGR